MRQKCFNYTVKLLTVTAILTWSWNCSAESNDMENNGNQQAGNSDAATYNERGLAAYQENQYRNALQQFRLAMEHDANEGEYPNNAGMSLLQLRRPDDAIPLFQKAIELNADRPLYRFNLGIALLETNQPRLAREQFLSVAETETENGEVWFRLGLANFSLQNYEEALQNFDRASSLVNDPEILNNAGMAAMENGQLEIAEDRFRKAVNMDNEHGRAHYNLGVLFHQKRRDFASAVEHYENAIEAAPGNPIPYFNLGIVHTNLGNTSDAIQAFENFLRRADSGMERQVRDARQRISDLEAGQ